MKTALAWLLGLSLAANAALLALRQFGPTPEPGARATESATVARAGTPSASAPAARVGGTASPIAPSAAPWRAVGSSDLNILVANLRAAGFPPKVVNAVVVALVNERFSAQEQELFYGGVDPKEYWKTGGAGGGILLDDPKKRAAMDQMYKERNDLLRDLLGTDWEYADENAASYLRRDFGNLPTEKLTALAELNRAYGDKRRGIFPSGRAPQPEEVTKLMDLDDQLRADVAKVLTPAELEQYDLRTSRTAGYLRSMASGFSATEEEYRALFAIYQPWVTQWERPYGNYSREQADARDVAQKQLEPLIAAALGAERYADFQQATNGQYRQLNQLVARLELPISVARDVAAVQTDVNGRANAVRSDGTLSAEERSARLAALAEEANTKVAAKLGAKGLAAYREYGGQWIQNLTARPRATPKG